MDRIEIKGSAKGLDSFFDNPLVDKLQANDTLEVNGIRWRVERMEIFSNARGEEHIHLNLVNIGGQS